MMIFILISKNFSLSFRFLKAYELEGVKFWGLTAQNEPTNVFIQKKINSLEFLPSWQRDFIKYNLGPTLAKNGFGKDKLKLMILDDQLPLILYWSKVLLSDEDCAKYISGIAIHWYINSITPRVLQDISHKHYPQYFILSTEASEGSFSFLSKGKY